MKQKNLLLLLLLQIAVMQLSHAQNIAINDNGAIPNAKAMLDISSTTMGLLIPRMTQTQRDAITTPPAGLQVFNTTTSTLEVYRSSRWESVVTNISSTNIVNVYALADLPTPSGSAITLDATKMYVFNGIINISPYYLNLNGAGLRGTDPQKDGVMSSVSGAVLRSTSVNVFMQDVAVLPASAATKGYDFTDASGTKFCNIFSGCSVVEIGIPSLGVGQVSGFKAVTIEKNYWNCADGIKVTGTMGKFCSAYNFVIGIGSSGKAIEFLAGVTIDDIDLSNNYFIYTGGTGVKLNTGATVDRGRVTTNMFRGVGTYLSGFDSYSPGWQMVQNPDIPNSRVYCYTYMNNNATATTLTNAATFYKIAGTTTQLKAQKFTTSSNRITYTGKTNLTAMVFVTVSGKSPASSADLAIAIAKNGTVISNPNSSMGNMANNQAYQLVLETEVDLVTNDYLEVFISRNTSAGSSVTISDIQFRVHD